MFSFLKKVISSVVPWQSDSPTDDPHEQDVLDCLTRLTANVEETLDSATDLQEKFFEQSDTVRHGTETIKCVYKSGTVTHLCDGYGLIDNVLYFEFKQVLAGLVLKINDDVLYSAYKVRDNEADRVYKVYALKNDSWDSYAETRDASVNQLLNEQKVEEIPAFTRCIVGRVTERKGRLVFIESADIWCDLDEVQSTYIPFEGDWVELKAVVSVCEDNADLSGDVLVVKSLKPLLKKTGIGRITLWSDVKKDGAIENLIYFTQFPCQEGYVPSLGDEVTYEAVESDQERYKWRAVKVKVNNINFQNKTLHNDNFIRDVEDSFSDKNGISILPFVCTVEVQFNQSKVVTFEVKNNGTAKQLLKFIKFNLNKNSQLILLSPKEPGPLYIHPKQLILFKFECKGRYLGLTGEILYFYFETFAIARRFEISVVGDKEMNKLLECKFGTVFKNFKDRKYIRSDDVETCDVSYGPRPWKLPKFVSRERKCVFNIPKKLWSITAESSQMLKSLLEYAPYLKSELNFDCYADWFHMLLYLEEIEVRFHLRQYDMNGVFLRRNDKYFALEVPGLAEKRPSLVVGDKVVLTQSWIRSDKTKHIGYIYDVLAKEVLIKFHPDFHNNYNESECDIVFEPGTAFFSRCHEAVNRSVKSLGADWLFPSAVNQKLSQILFDDSDEVPSSTKNAATSCEKISKLPSEKKQVPSSSGVRDLESNAKQAHGAFSGTPQKSKLIWANQNLNERQKLAVLNVLKGEGRPLPYIIFGPPGTGKTITLVEIIIQIYRLMPESRILVSTPSNSSADLICERLIEFGNLNPGQLVRLVAVYRVLEGLVPAKLIPYSTFAAKETVDKNLSKALLTNNVRSSSLTDLAGRHRITVGTCVTVGVLHYLGFSPGHFTHILLDEAGQTSEPEALITTTFQDIQSGQVVLAGDPQQLGPVVRSRVARTYGLGVSLLQRLVSTFPYARDLVGFPDTSGFDPRFITKLNVNYRTVPEILSLPSQLFYNSDLIPSVSQTFGKEANIIKSFNFEVEGRETPPAIIFDGIIGQNYQENNSPSWFNPHEIWQIIFYIKKLYSIGLKNDDIGIVTPYSKQVQKLRHLLAALDLSIPKIGSVEEFQGQERHVIILSTVRSSYKYVKSDVVHSLGFVASPQRLNVALTRARALLIIIGNPLLLSKDPYWINVVKYCLKNKSYTGCSLDSLTAPSKIECTDAEQAEQETEGQEGISDTP